MFVACPACPVSLLLWWYKTAVDAADTRQVLQVLSYTCKMLQRLPLRQQGLEAASTGSISFASLWELLLLLALKSEHAVVRCGTCMQDKDVPASSAWLVGGCNLDPC